MSGAPTHCPVCRSPLPSTGETCPTCGLPRELWPSGHGSAGTAAETGDDWLRSLELLKRDLPSGGFGPEPVSGPSEEWSEPTASPEEPVRVPAPVPGHSTPLQELVDQLSDLLQIGRRAGFNLARFGPEVAHLLDTMRSGDPELSRRPLVELRDRLHEEIARRLTERAGGISELLRTFEPFARIDRAQEYRDALKEALSVGDLRQAQVSFRRLEGEIGVLEEQLGGLGEVLRSVDQGKYWLKFLGGDPRPLEGLERRALEAARTGGRTAAETMFLEEAQRLEELLSHRVVDEMLELSQELRALKEDGREVHSAGLIARELTQELKVGRPVKAAQGLPRLKEEIRLARVRPEGAVVAR